MNNDVECVAETIAQRMELHIFVDIEKAIRRRGLSHFRDSWSSAYGMKWNVGCESYMTYNIANRDCSGELT